MRKEDEKALKDLPKSIVKDVAKKTIGQALTKKCNNYCDDINCYDNQMHLEKLECFMVERRKK